MARIYKKLYKSCTNEQLHLRGTQKTLAKVEWVYFVHVCSFIFTFSAVSEIGEYLDYYSNSIKPSARLREHSYAPSTGSLGSHWERQSKFDELPLYLFKESNRIKVVAALRRAQKMFDGQHGSHGSLRGGARDL